MTIVEKRAYILYTSYTDISLHLCLTLRITALTLCLSQHSLRLVHANWVACPLALYCWQLNPRKQYIPTFLKNQHSGFSSGYMCFQFHKQVVTVLSIYAIHILFKKSFSTKMSSRLFPKICFIRFSVAGFILDFFDTLSDPIYQHHLQKMLSCY